MAGEDASRIAPSGGVAWLGAKGGAAAGLVVLPAILAGVLVPQAWRRAVPDACSLACGIGLASGIGVATAMAALLLFVHAGYSAGLWVAAAAYGAAAPASLASARS